MLNTHRRLINHQTSRQTAENADIAMCLCYTNWYTSTPNIGWCREVSSCRIMGLEKRPIRLKSATPRHVTVFPVREP